MKRFISRVFALLLVCVMCAALPLSAQASIITPPAGSTHLFGITSTGFYNELRTDASGKMFATYNHVGKTIWIVGTMTHSSSRNFTVGLCHKVAPSGLFRYETAGFGQAETIPILIRLTGCQRIAVTRMLRLTMYTFKTLLDMVR